MMICCGAPLPKDSPPYPRDLLAMHGGLLLLTLIIIAFNWCVRSKRKPKP